MNAIACQTCGKVHREILVPGGYALRCVRCRATIRRRWMGSMHLSAAFALSALLLYIPANIFPILRLEMYGLTTQSTVLNGIVRFYQDGDWFLAFIVLMASIVIPALKLLGLFSLMLCVRLRIERGRRVRTWIYRFIDAIGRWAMLDVFMLAIWVGLVKLHTVGRVTAGPGAVPFALVVVCTLLASAVFDPKMIWDGEDADS